MGRAASAMPSCSTGRRSPGRSPTTYPSCRTRGGTTPASRCRVWRRSTSSPSAAVADVRADGATVYVGTHRPFGVREQIAKAIGIDERKVRVIPQITSGTYGRNTHGDAAIEAAILSKAAGRPVLLQWTREEEFVWSPSRPE